MNLLLDTLNSSTVPPLAQHRGPDIDVGQLVYLAAALVATVIGALMKRKPKSPPPTSAEPTEDTQRASDPARLPTEVPRPAPPAGQRPLPPRRPSLADARPEELNREQLERLRRRVAARFTEPAAPPTVAPPSPPSARAVALAARPAADGSPAARLRRALRTPADLQTAVLLTEVLGPPLALRE